MPATKKVRYIQPVYLPGKHKGKISPAAIRAAVKKVVAERRLAEARRASGDILLHAGGVSDWSQG